MMLTFRCRDKSVSLLLLLLQSTLVSILTSSPGSVTEMAGLGMRLVVPQFQSLSLSTHAQFVVPNM